MTSFHPKLPAELVDHVKELMEGSVRIIRGVEIRERVALNDSDTEALERLVLDPVMADRWGELRSYLGDKGASHLLSRVFDVLWAYRLDYAMIRRFSDGRKRKSEQKKTVEKISETISQLREQMRELQEAAAPWGGAGRHPDRWPVGSPGLFAELDYLADQCERFDAAEISYDQAINAALEGRKGEHDYLRAVIAALVEINFPLDDKQSIPNALLDLVGLASGRDDGGPGYHAAYKALRFVLKNENESKIPPALK